MIKFDPIILEFEDFSEIMNKAENLTFQKKEMIVQSGSVCKYLYFIEKGLLRSYYFDLKGNDVTHWFACEHMFMTIPPSFFNRDVSGFNLEALENTKVKALSIDVLENAFEDYRRIETFCRTMVTQTMIALGQKVIDLQTKTTLERYKDFIETYPDIYQRASLGHIATYIGMTQQNLSRIRSTTL